MAKELIRLSDCFVQFDDDIILDHINLYINDKEFLTLLGPSGCGKTTTLRLIGGFLKPTSGEVLFDGAKINDVPPHKRAVNTVFQKYALFPHLNVFENIAFGLRIPKTESDGKKQRKIKLSEEEIQRRVQLVRNEFKGQKFLKLRWHEPAMSHLVGILSRADRRLADVVEKVYRKGGIFTSWIEGFDLAPWLEALEECGLTADEFTRARGMDEYLPWEHLEAGISPEFLRREYERALEGKVTEDCRYHACRQCGACDTKAGPSRMPHASLGEDGRPLEHHNRLVFPQRDQQAHQPARDEEGRIICRTHENKPPQIAPELAVKAVQYRIWHTKTGGSSYLSQLELQAILDRALRRADLPMAFSQGFHPMPLMSFGRALPVGMESRAEWFAITLRTPMSAAEVHTRLAAALPTGMAVIRVEEVDKSRRTEQSVAETFRLRTGNIDGEGLSLAAVRDCFAAFAAQESVMLTRETKKGPRTSDIRRHLLRWKELEDGSLEFSLDWSDGYLSPLLLCTSICASLGDESRLRALLRLSKTAQHFADGQVCP